MCNLIDMWFKFNPELLNALIDVSRTLSLLDAALHGSGLAASHHIYNRAYAVSETPALFHQPLSHCDLLSLSSAGPRVEQGTRRLGRGQQEQRIKRFGPMFANQAPIAAS